MANSRGEERRAFSTYTHAERRAYYMGYGAGLCGHKIGDEQTSNLIDRFPEAECLSFVRGVLDGNERSPNK